MTLASYYTEVQGKQVGAGTWVSDVFVKDAVASFTDFTVSPSPCVNPGDHHSPNAYSFRKEFCEFPSGEQRIVTSYTSPPSVHTSTFSGPLEPGVPWVAWTWLTPSDDGAYNKALGKLVDKLRDSELNVATSVGEARETLGMLMSIAQGASRALRLLQKAKRSPAGREELRKLLTSFGKNYLRNPLQQTGSAWLAWSVGVAPLLADIDNWRNHVLSGRDLSLRFKLDSRASAYQKDSTTFLVSDHAWRIEMEHSHRVEFGAEFEITNLHQFENWRAGLTARPTLVWELTTLSFVVDYFYNIGQYLELYEASVLNNGVRLVSGYCTHGTKNEQQKSLAYSSRQQYPAGHWAEWEFISRSYHCRRSVTTKARSLIHSLPVPNLPTPTIPKASTPLLNIAALLSQFLSEKK